MWWGMAWATPGSIAGLLEWWQGVKFKGFKNVIWETTPFVIMWTVWKMRNEKIFETVGPKWDEVIELIKYKVAVWARLKMKDSPYSVNDIMYNLGCIL